MKKALERIWFQPYTPVVFLLLIIFAMYRLVYPTFQQAINPQHFAFPEPTATPTPLPPGKTETQILEEIGKLMVLPADERPQIIPITEIEKFKDQPFFKNAKNGDILLIYGKNKKAILYDPKAHKIIDTAPINLPEPTPTRSPSEALITHPSPTPPEAGPSASSTPILTPPEEEPTASPIDTPTASPSP